MQRIPTMKTRPFWRMLNIILLALLFCGTSAWAGTLENLRASGAIGESYNGYVVARDPGAQAEADAVNAKRKQFIRKKPLPKELALIRWVKCMRKKYSKMFLLEPGFNSMAIGPKNNQ